MTATEVLPQPQALRLVTDNDNDNASDNDNDSNENSYSTSEFVHIAVHPDPASGKDVIFWDDIKAVFDDVIQVRSNDSIQSFLNGSDFKVLEPLRIAAVPGATLDVVVRDKAGLSLELLQMALPSGEVDDNTPPNCETSVAASGRNPAHGLENVAMEALKNNENPDTKLLTLQDDKSPPNSNATSPTSQNAKLKTQPPRAPQETASDAAKNVARTMMNARLGDNKARVALGDMYRDGRGVRQDYEAAMDWYRKSADQRYAEAQCRVGLLYHNGQGVRRTYDIALDWYRKAADQGYAHGWHLKHDYSLAMEWYLKASDQGLAEAQYNIGYLYHQGFGMAQDHSQAMDWYLKAAEKGNATAQSCVGVMYQHGQGVPQDDTLALSWYRKAAAWGNANAQFNLGLTYEYGMGVLMNRETAVEWYKKAADKGDTEAKEKLKELQ
ncbi:hypothetical protein BGZ96_003878, partial [Linnemannia gamsii]